MSADEKGVERFIISNQTDQKFYLEAVTGTLLDNGIMTLFVHVFIYLPEGRDFQVYPLEPNKYLEISFPERRHVLFAVNGPTLGCDREVTNDEIRLVIKNIVSGQN